MISNEISKFMALAPLVMPRYVCNNGDTDSDINEEYAIMFFSFGEKLPIGIYLR